MNITIISDVYGISDNGTCVTCKNLALQMVKRGHNVTIISPFAGENESGINYIELPIRHFWALNFILEKNGVRLAKPIKEKIIQGIKNADIVHLLLGFKTSRATLPLLFKYKIPFTTAFHAQAENISSHIGLIHSKSFNRYLYNRLYKKFYSKVQFIHTPSQFCADILNENGYKNKFYIITNGFNPKFRKIKNAKKPQKFKNKFIILNTGRYCKEKRTKILIDAINHSKHEKDIQLILLGQGPDERKLKKYGKKLTNKPITKYLQFDKFLNTLNYADLYVHPSEIEIEGISCLEAMACGLPCIFSDSKASATRYYAKDGRSLFKCNDAENLAEKIDYLYEHPEERKKLANYYLGFSKNFEMDKAMDKMEQMFKDAITFYKDFYKK